VLADVLSRTAHEALAQRIVVSYAFRGIAADEAAPYVEAMLRCAGAAPTVFDPVAVAAAHGCRDGSIRRLNQVLTGALRIGAQQGAASVDAEMVLSASQEASLR
jgi:type II secretory pathway predicted ATPase ExeA